jgi:signal transduction histidine kinase
MTKSDIFWKSWWWSAVSGASVGILFLIITSFPLFDGVFRRISFIDILVVLSVLGCYAGAGYVGSRIATKYFEGPGRFAGRYIRFSLLSFVVLVAIALSPLSFLMILWSFIAPYCVLLTLRGFEPRHLKQSTSNKPRARRRPATL